MILLEYQHIKNFWKGNVSNWSEKVFAIKKVKKHCAVDICY